MDVLRKALQQIRLVEARKTLGELGDGELLARFVDAHDAFAFTVLVQRHAPMTLAVCRRTLHCPHDCLDACQAVFLVLAQRASSIRSSTSLNCWLHGVALRIAKKMKQQQSRREAREQRAQLLPFAHERQSADPLTEASWNEVRMVLDEELQRLPENTRAVLILCYLEGLSRDEAAERLQLSLGAVRGLLERGRKLLAQRLSKRGLTLSAALLASAVGQGTANATLPAATVHATVNAAVMGLDALGQAALVSESVRTLTLSFLKEMTMWKTKFASAAAVCTLALVSIVGFGWAQEPAPSPKAKTNYALLKQPSTAESDDAFIRRVSLDLRGKQPSKAEVHFFVANKDAKKREKLIDLFIEERQVSRDKGERENRLREYTATVLTQVKDKARDQIAETKKKDEEREVIAREATTLARLAKTQALLAERAKIPGKNIVLRACEINASVKPSDQVIPRVFWDQTWCLTINFTSSECALGWLLQGGRRAHSGEVRHRAGDGAEARSDQADQHRQIQQEVPDHFLQRLNLGHRWRCGLWPGRGTGEGRIGVAAIARSGHEQSHQDRHSADLGEVVGCPW
jgi:RNA polymerase sigma factor (sigma-70 family)